MFTWSAPGGQSVVVHRPSGADEVVVDKDVDDQCGGGEKDNDESPAPLPVPAAPPRSSGAWATASELLHAEAARVHRMLQEAAGREGAVFALAAYALYLQMRVWELQSAAGQ